MLELTAVHLAPGQSQAVSQGERCIRAHSAPEIFERFNGFVVTIRRHELLGGCERIRKVVADERKRRHGGKFEEGSRSSHPSKHREDAAAVD
jgi:hypothetical protein